MKRCTKSKCRKEEKWGRKHGIYQDQDVLNLTELEDKKELCFTESLSETILHFFIVQLGYFYYQVWSFKVEHHLFLTPIKLMQIMNHELSRLFGIKKKQQQKLCFSATYNFNLQINQIYYYIKILCCPAMLLKYLLVPPLDDWNHASSAYGGCTSDKPGKWMNIAL